MLLSQQPGSRITAEYTKVSGSSHILIQLESKLGSRDLFCNKSIQHLGNYIWPILPPKKTKISDCFAICYTLYMSYSYHCLTYHLDTLGIFFVKVRTWRIWNLFIRKWEITLHGRRRAAEAHTPELWAHLASVSFRHDWGREVTPMGCCICRCLAMRLLQIRNIHHASRQICRLP